MDRSEGNRKAHLDLFTESGCLSDFGFVRYLSDSLTTSECLVLEDHLQQCNECLGALCIMIRGLSELEPARSEATPSEIGQEPTLKARMRSAVLNILPALASPRFAYIACALVLVLVLGGTFAWMRSRLGWSQRLYAQGVESLRSVPEFERSAGVKFITAPLEPGAKQDPQGAPHGDLKALDQALLYFGQVLALNPKHVQARVALGQVYLVKRRPDEAESQFRQALKLDRNNLEATNGLGIALFERAMLEQDPHNKDELLKASSDTFAKILVAQPGKLEALYNEAITRYILGERVRTLNLIEKYLALDSGSGWAKKLVAIRDKLQLNSYQHFDEAVKEAFKKRQLERLGQIVSASPHAVWLIKKSLRTSLKLEVEGDLSRAREAFQVAEAVEKAYREFTKDENYHALFDFYRKLTEQQKKAKYQADHLAEAMFADYEKGNHEEALKLSARALIIYQNLHEYWQGAIVHHLRGNSYFYYRSDYDRALQAYKEMAVAAERGSDLDALTRALGGMSVIYQDRGEYYKMRTHLDQMLAVAERTRNLVRQAFALTHLGNLHRELGDSDTSMDYYNKALTVSRIAGNSTDELENIEHIGLLYQRNKEYGKAIAFFDKGLQLLAEVELGPEQVLGRSRIRRTRHHLLCYQAENYMATGQWEKAKVLLQQAEEIAKSLENQEVNISTLFRQGVFSLATGNHHEAYEQLTSAILLAKERRLPDFEWRGHYLLGNVLRKKGDLLAAQEAYHQAIRIIESLNSYVPEGKLAMSFLADRYDPYIAMVTLMGKELKDQTAAFGYFERSKARILLDQLANKTPEAKLRAKNFVAEGSEMLDDLQKRLPRDLVIVEYFVGTTEILVFIISADSFHCLPLPVSKDKILWLANVFLDHLQSKRFDESKRAGNELYKILIAPIRSHFRPQSTLCIIPDDRLYFIPFPSLVTDEDRFLIEEYRFTQVPSAAILRRYLSLDKGEAAGKGRKVLAVAADLNTPDARVEAETIHEYYKPHSIYLDRLDRQELARLVPHFEILHFSGHAAIWKDGSPVLVFTSARSPSRLDPWISSSSRHSGDREEPLRSDDVMRWDLSSTRLVTLSACGTGLGKHLRGEGVIGLTHAFLSAGASALLASLWKVDTAATRFLMEHFYANLQKDGMSKAEALRRAQMDMLTLNEPFRAPYYWAPFILIGDPR